MNINMKRVGSLFLVLALVLSFLLQAQATADSPGLTQELSVENTLNTLPSDLLKSSTDESLKEENPKGASGQETPASGPTITPFSTQEFIIVGVTGNGKLMIDPISSQGKMLFVNESGISFTYSTVAYGSPYRYNTAPNWDYIVSNSFTVDIISVPEGIIEYSLEAALANDVNGSSGMPEHKWRYDNAQVYILIQRVKSFTTVTGAINPTAINVGRESVNDIYSGEPTKPPTFFWEITKVGDPIPVLSGKDNQPDMDAVNKLSPGDYTVTTTATEYFPDAYIGIDGKGDSVTHTTSDDFKVTVGNVIVEHLDAATNQPIPSVTNTTIPGTFKRDTYKTIPADIPGYKLEVTPANKEGVFTDVDQTVTYKYTKLMTQVKVEHVYEDGTPIIDPVTTTGHATVDTIATEQLVMPNIEIFDVEVDAASQGNTNNVTATYPESGLITVTYVYRKVMTQVKVEHVYEDGTPVISPPVTTTGNATIETIQTNQLSQKDIKIVDVKIDNVSQGNTSDYLATYPPSGITTVTYVYKKVMTKVTVKHIYEDGSLVPGHPAVTKSGQVGTTTSTSKLTGETIVKVLIDGTDTGNTSNVVATFPDTGSITITYVYKEKATLVVEHLFFEEDGITVSNEPTQKERVKTDFVGEAYTTRPLTTVPKGFILKSFANSGNVDGIYVSGVTKVTYSYKRIPAVPPQGPLEVKHIFLDENGKVVKTPATITYNYTGNIDSAYNTIPLLSSEIPEGYQLVQNQLPANASGIYKDTPTSVKYYYKPMPKVLPGQGTVNVVHAIRHTDGFATTYKKEDPIIGDIDNPYTTAPIGIPGYILEKAPYNAKGKIASGDQTVIYVYIPDPAQAQLMERHLIIDAKGNIKGVIDTVATTRPDGTPYSTRSRTPAGYKLVTTRLPSNPKGKYIVGQEQVVTYYYASLTETPAPVPNPDGTSGSGGSGSGSSWNTGDSSTENKKPTPDATINPQTGDTTSQGFVLSILFAVLAVALVILGANFLIPKKIRKR